MARPALANERFKDLVLVSAFLTGVAAGVADLTYVANWVSSGVAMMMVGSLGALYFGLAALSLFYRRRDALWVLLPAPVVLFGPALMALLLGACAVNQGSCI